MTTMFINLGQLGVVRRGWVSPTFWRNLGFRCRNTLFFMPLDCQTGSDSAAKPPKRDLAN